MLKRNLIRGLLVCMLALPGLGGILTAQTATAQGGQNLLANPGFEGFYRSFDYNEPSRGLVLEFRIADGWRPWFREQGPSDPEWRYRRPEYRPASYSYNGTAAQQFFTSFSTHEAGLWQQVRGTVPGRTYRFSIAAYIWSSNGGNFLRSEQPGEARVRVGVDPTGGTNPWATNVRWSPFATFYDEWRVLGVDAVAEGSTATVFVWSSQQYPVVHNDVAVDDAYFGLAAGAPLQQPNIEQPVVGQSVEPSEPVVTQAPAALGAGPTGVTVTADVDLRLRARVYGQVLDVIPAGVAVSVVGRSEDRNWTQVAYNGQQGWIASWIGVYSSAYDDLPVVPLP